MARKEAYVSKHAKPEKAAQFSNVEQVQIEAERETRPAGRPWYRGLLIFALVFLLIGAAGCFVLYRYCAAYEVCRPEIVMDEIMETYTVDDWKRTALDSIGLYTSEYEDNSSLVEAYFDSLDESVPVTYRKEVNSSNDSLAVYTVRAGISNLARVTLIPSEDVSRIFRLHGWQLGGISAENVLDSLKHVTVKVFAPENEDVYINGFKAGSAISLSGIAWPKLTEIESKFTTGSKCTCYTVDAMYGAISVTDSAGTEYSPTDLSTATELVYQVAPAELHSVRITAPEDVTVTLCGYELTPADARSISPEIFENVLEYTQGSEYMTAEYSFSNLFSQPEVSAVDKDGRQLTPVTDGKGNYAFLHSNDPALETEMLETVQSFFDAYVTYCANSYDATRFDRVINRVMRHSTLYTYISESHEGMIFASKTQSDTDVLEFGNFSWVGDNCFICTVSYKANLTATSWYEEFSYDLDSNYEICFTTDGYKWLATDMTSIPE